MCFSALPLLQPQSLPHSALLYSKMLAAAMEAADGIEELTCRESSRTTVPTTNTRVQYVHAAQRTSQRQDLQSRVPSVRFAHTLNF